MVTAARTANFHPDFGRVGNLIYLLSNCLAGQEPGSQSFLTRCAQ